MFLFGALLIYEIYLLVCAPTIPLGLFAFVDAAIILLAAREYRQLKGQVHQGSVSVQPGPDL
jgi:uncharacterized membrane protein